MSTVILELVGRKLNLAKTERTWKKLGNRHSDADSCIVQCISSTRLADYSQNKDLGVRVFVTLFFQFLCRLLTYYMLRLWWSRGSVLAFSTKVRGFKPARSCRIFQGERILSTPSFGREVKPFVPCRIFAECKRTRKCMRGSRSFRSKLPAIFRPSSSSFHYQGLWWRHLAVHVGTTKDQGL